MLSSSFNLFFEYAVIITWVCSIYVVNTIAQMYKKVVPVYVIRIILHVLVVIACIFYPGYVGNNIWTDLAFIPFLLIVIYDGLVTGILTAGIVLILRGLSLKMHIIPTIIAIGFILLIAALTKKSFQETRLRIMWGIWYSLLYTTFTIGELLIYSAYLNHVNPAVYHPIRVHTVANFGAIYASIAMIGLCCAIFLMEKLREVQQMSEEIHRLERLNLAGQMAASMAHEIRNPMTSIQGFVQLLLHDNLPADTTRKLDIIYREARQVESIINDYLTLAQPTAHEFQLFSLHELIDTVIQSFQQDLKERDLTVVSTVSEVTMFSDRNKLRQVFSYLIRNAMEGMDQAGEITLTSFHDENRVSVIMKDHGVGFEETAKELSRLGFTAYDTKSAGTGIGMMMCYQVVEGLGGRIRFRHDPEEGNITIVTLPCHTRETMPSV
jgi:two-component system sporulation sensor kinase B